MVPHHRPNVYLRLLRLRSSNAKVGCVHPSGREDPITVIAGGPSEPVHGATLSAMPGNPRGSSSTLNSIVRLRDWVNSYRQRRYVLSDFSGTCFGPFHIADSKENPEAAAN